jgi:hypothetical protein
MPKQNKQHIFAWNEGLLNIKKQLLDYTPSIFNNTDYTAVIIEPRNHKDLEVICKNVMYYLNESNSDVNWGLKIYHGNKNKEFVKNFTKDWNIQLENLEVDDLSGILYNNMLKTTKFWNTIPTENVLIFQTDTILRRFGIDEFISYNYVGAPWIRHREGKNVGNGGLSFRKKSRMLDITKEFQDDEITMEDIYFCKYLKDEDIAPYNVAKKFSVEDVYYENPLGLHQPKIEPKLISSLLITNLHKDNFIKIKYRVSNSYTKSLKEYVNDGELIEIKRYFLPYENMNILIDDLLEPFSFLGKNQINDINNFLIEKNIKIKYLCTGWPTSEDLQFSNTNIQILRSPFSMAYYWKQWLEEKFDNNIEDINFDYKFNKLFYTLTRNPKYHRCLLLDKLCENNLLFKGEYNFLINSWKNGINYDFKCFDGIPKTFSDEDDIVSSATDVITPLLSNIDGFVNIVTETFHQHYSGIYFSEKTFYPIFYKRPFLVFSVPNFYKKFVECGFKLYDEVFDYSFDSEIDVTKKCELIIENIKRLEGKDLNKLYKTLYKKIEFNQKRLLDIINNNNYESIEIKEHTGLYNKNIKL